MGTTPSTSSTSSTRSTRTARSTGSTGSTRGTGTSRAASRTGTVGRAQARTGSRTTRPPGPAPEPPVLPTSAPLPGSAVELLARSDAELLAAQLADDPRDRFLHAHLAAIRAGAALLQVTGRPFRRPAPRTVWDMVALVAPELSRWTAFFADGAAVRAAIEAGREDGVDDARAERTVSAAEDFGDAVRAVLGPEASGEQQRLALRAS